MEAQDRKTRKKLTWKHWVAIGVGIALALLMVAVVHENFIVQTRLG